MAQANHFHRIVPEDQGQHAAAGGRPAFGDETQRPMKLDRNTNPDGRGKYALINLRKITEEDFTELLESRRDEGCFVLPPACLTFGDERGEQFFVIKYKDRFAEAALRGYAQAVRAAAFELMPNQVEEHKSLIEFADEIDREADAAAAHPSKKLPD